jgi:putative flippase GtrA
MTSGVQRLATVCSRSFAKYQVLRFLLVGVSNTLISFLTYLLVVAVLPATGGMASLAQAVSYAAGIGWSYMLNRKWVFRSDQPVLNEGGRFVGTQLTMLILSTGAIGLAVDKFEVQRVLAWFVVMVPMTLLNFLVLRLWAFRSK